MPYILDDLELGVLVRILNQHSAQTSADPCLSALLGNLEHAWRRSQMPFASTSELFGHLDDNAANLDAEQASFPVARHHGVYSDVDDHLSDSDNPDAGFQTPQKKRRHSVCLQGGNQAYTNPTLTQRGIDFTQEERLEGGMDLVRDGLGAWMEEMGGHGLGMDSGLKENEVDLEDDGQDRGRSRILAPRGNGLCGAERAAKRRRLAHVNEIIINGNAVNENAVNENAINGNSVNETTITSRSSVNENIANAAGGNLDIAHENIGSTVNGNANNANMSANAPRVRAWGRARARSPCQRGGCPPPRFVVGSRRPVQLTYAERLMSSIVNASQNLDSRYPLGKGDRCVSN
ncbi:hypothetical protein K443DRAFT_15477 [Laccaria amethystina LaAM-08-1]|uniref:Uncharacterized protein n=1 Tax=Laccaria amethystina LaAM-08-1 TaxID=1095629 RepID=A0A0C9WGW4_9AGAR|nr:hypothetical protein K443DRAFT_15477 [Laccaria amethystina LaAM-08-1]